MDRHGTPDYVIVGAGSAGCILAARLSEQEDVSVVLLEAGGSDVHPMIRMPSALSYPMNTARYDWGFETEAEPGLDGRRLHCPRGHVLGGSSSINGMVFVRGHPRDFDEWHESGATGWHHAACLPYFRRLERWMHGGTDWRGGEGPVPVNNGNDMRLNPLYEAFIEAGADAGYPKTGDYNAAQQEGFGPMQMNVDDGIRASTARCFLDPVRSRPNLRVITHVLVDRVEFEGSRAVGVRYRAAGRQLGIRAQREIILCAGSIGSPTILQRSGIGPAGVLEKAGVEVRHELPGVGANLQDHLEVYFQYRCLKPVSLNRQLTLLRKARIGLRWLLTRKGLGATNHFEACAFIRSRAGLRWPNLQYHFLPAAMRYDGRVAFAGDGFQVHVGPNKPVARGRVEIRDRDPRRAPSIQFNYLVDEEDRRDWRDTIRLTRDIIGQASMNPYRGDEIQPGAEVRDDAAIDRWVRQNVESAYHPCGTVRMGDPGDAESVCDPECRVIGVENLRVIDSSLFPTIPNGNLNAPTMMLAERGADIVAGRGMLSPEPRRVWEADGWQGAQRCASGRMVETAGAG